MVPPNTNTGISSGTSSGAGSVSSGRRHRRISSLNTVSWPNPNELTTHPRQRRMSTVASSNASKVKYKIIRNFSHDNFTCIQEIDEKAFASPRVKSPRRKSSYSTSIAPDELTLDPSSRRRSSFVTSWAIDDDDDDDREGLTTTTRTARRRKYSWGVVGESGFRDSIRSASSRSPVSHHECN